MKFTFDFTLVQESLSTFVFCMLKANKFYARNLLQSCENDPFSTRQIKVKGTIKEIVSKGQNATRQSLGGKGSSNVNSRVEKKVKKERTLARVTDRGQCWCVHGAVCGNKILFKRMQAT